MVSDTGVARCWALVPAAGMGTRMGSGIPKQYLPLAGQTVLQHSVEKLLQHPDINGTVVALSDSDPYWEKLNIQTNGKPVVRVAGGAERCHSVLNGLKALEQTAQAYDWVLVHDAARPCVRLEDISLLIEALRSDPVGGLLAVPVNDTIKRARGESDPQVMSTVDRHNLWQAQTPQMFHLQPLKQALEHALQQDFLVTDEASAMEFMGLKPKLIQGHADNIKITRPEDLALAEFYLQRGMKP